MHKLWTMEHKFASGGQEGTDVLPVSCPIPLSVSLLFNSSEILVKSSKKDCFILSLVCLFYLSPAYLQNCQLLSKVPGLGRSKRETRKENYVSSTAFQPKLITGDADLTTGQPMGETFCYSSSPLTRRR